MADFRQPLHKDLSDFLAAKRLDRPKELGAAIDVDPRTARNVLDGHWPGRDALKGLVRAFGYDVLEVVFASEIDDATARQTAELKRQEKLLEDRKARRRAVAGAANDLAPDSEQ